ncbi:MAG TPA: ferritin-like domain-containing protein [Solirubrobacterales bacterium]|nr:ferritin-like domain-containing protein [Solirubrobacterales bacterium]
MLVLAVAGCGKSGQGAKTDPEKAADVAILNGLLTQELILVDAYGRGLDRLQGPVLDAAAEFRGQSQAHANALTKAIRGLGGETEAEAVEAELRGPRSREEALRRDYEEENRALALALEAAPRLQFDAPRTLAAVLAANHAQHLAVLRQGLGATPAASVPEPFETGEEPPPAKPADGPETAK